MKSNTGKNVTIKDMILRMGLRARSRQEGPQMGAAEGVDQLSTCMVKEEGTPCFQNSEFSHRSEVILNNDRMSESEGSGKPQYKHQPRPKSAVSTVLSNAPDSKDIFEKDQSRKNNSSD